MEEIKKEIIEDESLNNNNDVQGDDNDKSTYTKEEVEEMKKKMQSDSEKGVQKLIGKTKAYEKVFEHLTEVSENPSKLVEIYDENPEVAQVILDKYFNGQDIEEYKTSISYEENYQDPKYVKKMIEKEANKMAEMKEIEAKKEAFINKLSLSEEEIKKFEEAFEDRKSMKSYKNSDIDKHLEKAFLEIADVEQLNKIKEQDIIGKSQAKTTGKGSISEKKGEGLKNEIGDFLKTHKIV